MKKIAYIFVLLTLFSGFVTHAQYQKKVYFAIGLFTSNHSQMVTYAFITTVNGSVSGAEIIRKDRFIYSALGYWPSDANPEKIDLFAKHNVDSVLLVVNENNKVIGYYEKPFETLWMIRFKENPYKYDEFGWSQGTYRPSDSQQAFLRHEYGVNNILTDYIYGDSLFKLLRDVQSPGWVSAYKAGAIIDTTSTTDTTTSP
ncbi:MAG: hypothetical protein R2780_07600 [Crocinitomicaceae bacterium]|nr:hypothetical protein [Crocinitomicaceae bacterium]